MAFPGANYAPPSVYTKTLFENPLAGALEALKIPVLIGEGNEFLSQADLEIVRGSSSTVDQRIVREDMTGRAVVSVSVTNVVTLGSFDGVLTKLQVRNFPIVTGDGTGTSSNNRQDVSVLINGKPIVVLSVVGSTGIIELAQPPKIGDIVQVTYYFNRTDTLVTDDVSAQVTATTAIVRAQTGVGDVDATNPAAPAAVLDFHGDILNAQGAVVVPANNVLVIEVDGTDQTITLPPRADYTIAQVATIISAARKGTLTAARFNDQFGHSALSLSSNHSLKVKTGSANATLGLAEGQMSTRRATFYTFNGPIVDGKNGGVTTTDPADVTVKVNGKQVVPTKVDGATRAVTLAQAPAPNATVSITYYFNTWQDTFDYLAHIGITQVVSCGDVPASSSYNQDADFVLKDDRILWGTAATVESGINTSGTEFFDDTQISTTLVDNRGYLEECSAVTESSGGLSVASQTKFQLPNSPTLGNGRDTPLGSSLFQTVSNSRIDVPVNRPDVVDVYWGFGINDALVRGKVTVLSVEGTVVEIAEVVPPGATVYASFYYNRLTDNEYTLTVVNPGVSGVGTYTVKDKGGTEILNPSFNVGSKGAGLNGISLEFPSGSELTPDLRHESVTDEDFIGPVAEVVTVEFAARPASPGRWSAPGAGPYEFVLASSDNFSVSFDNAAALTIDLASPLVAGGSQHDGGFFASLVGGEIVYDGGANAITGAAYDITASEQVVIAIDDAVVTATTNTAVNNQTGQIIVDAINQAAAGHVSLADADGADTTSIELNAAVRSNVDGYYIGWNVVIGNGAGTITAGQTRTVTAYNGTTGIATVSAAFAGGDGAVDNNDPYAIYNPAARSSMASATRFNGPVTLSNNVNGQYNQLQFVLTHRRGGATETTNALTAVVGNGPWNTPAALAAEVQARMQAAIDAFIGAPNANWEGTEVHVTGGSNGQLEFRLQAGGLASAMTLQFITGDTILEDFCVFAGLDTAGAAGAGQAALLQGPVARLTGGAVGGLRPYDRIVLRNRLLPGSGGTMSGRNVAAQCKLEVQAGNVRSGLTTGDKGVAGTSAAVLPPSVVGRTGLAGGQAAATAEPEVTFFSGTGATPQNNVFNFTLDGVAISVTFTNAAGAAVAATGSAVPLGPAATANTIVNQIAAAIAAVPGTPFGANAAAVLAAGIVGLEGAGIRITSTLSSTAAQVTVASGNANNVLGFADGATASRTLVEPGMAASALMGDAQANDFNADLLQFTQAAARFAGQGLASVARDSANREYLYLQSLTTGAGSVVSVRDAAADNALNQGTRLGAVANDGGVGEAAVDGFFVTSNVANGSGTTNDSNLNDGTGQDGVVGQTYRDKVTGLTFTLLPRGWSDDQVGPWVAYPTGNTATFRINVAPTFVTNANLPVTPLNGVEVKVANTSAIGAGDTAIVKTHERGGTEPANGDVYYASYIYKKQDYTTAFFTKMRAIEQAFGAVSPNNPLSLAAWLSMLNGSVLVGCKQVPRAEGSNYADLATYKAAVTELEGVLPGQALPDIITPLRGDSEDLYQVLKKSNDIQSSIRYKSERTSIVGVQSGTLPKTVQALAQKLGNTRMRLVYPDMATIQIQSNDGTSEEVLVDGPMIAAALAGSIVSPNVDVATPWTGRTLVGFTQLARQLDAVEQNQTAVKGVTVLQDRPPFLRVRHGLTTDMKNVLTKTPTIIMIADEVQRQARTTLEQFIGIKFLPGVLSQVEGRLAMMLKSLVKAQIISAYTGVKANVSPDDPTVAEVEAFYSPIFPLLYLVLTFHLRSSL